jgi:hypothetical protein
MAETTPLKSPEYTALAELGSKIKALHAEVIEAGRNVVRKAIEAGVALIEAKGKVRHGEWLPWLKRCCGFSERTAQDYMKLARHRQKVEEKLKSALGADFGLKDALRMVDDDGNTQKEDAGPLGRYQKARAALIKKLGKLEPDDVEDAVSQTVTELQAAVAELKKPVASKAAA